MVNFKRLCYHILLIILKWMYTLMIPILKKVSINKKKQQESFTLKFNLLVK